MIMHIQRALAYSEQFIQGYLGIFRNIDAYAATLTGVRLRNFGLNFAFKM